MLVVLAGLAVVIVERGWANDSFLYAVWKSFTLTLDPGNLAGVEGSFGLILIAALSTVGGLFITSSLISVLNTGLTNRVKNFQSGNAKIIEKNHVVILGYSEAVFAIVNELLIANENKKSCSIVILGDEDKQVMEDQIHWRSSISKTTQIICRNGDTASTVDLERCSIESCKSVIIILSQDHKVIRTLLAVTNYLNDKKISRNQNQNSQKIHITVSINDHKNLEVARIAGDGFAEVFHFRMIISRIIAHVCYQPGLSTVYTELFNFYGNEIYIEPFPELEGKTFLDAQLSFPSSIVIGISGDGTSALNPDPTVVLKKEDFLILIAEDDNVSKPMEIPSIIMDDQLESVEKYRMSSPEDLLILGNSSFWKIY